MRELLLDYSQKLADLLVNLPAYAAPKNSPAPKIIAHRGAWDLDDTLENTMRAFLKARALGAWGIECDVHFTKDGVPVVHHDPDLMRCHREPGELCELSFPELRRRIPAIPTLEEVMSLDGLHFMIEIKTALSASHQEILRRHLARHQPVNDYHLLSLSPDLIRVDSSMPESAWILVAELNVKPFVKVSLQRGLAGVASHYLGMNRTSIDLLHGKNQKAGVGFTPTRNLLRREWGRGIDWVFTNHLKQLVTL